MIHIKTAARREVTIRRNDGVVDTVDVSDRFPFLDEDIASKIKEATFKAGRGALVSWRVIPAEIYDDHMDTCDRCTAAVDDRIAHSRIVHIGHVPVKTLYCTTCAQIINAMHD